MKLYDVKLLTITCEILAQKNVIEILKNHDITGYTTYEVEGNGAKGLRGQGFKNEKNVKVEVVMREEKLSGVVEDISRTLCKDFLRKSCTSIWLMAGKGQHICGSSC